MECFFWIGERWLGAILSLLLEYVFGSLLGMYMLFGLADGMLDP